MGLTPSVCSAAKLTNFYRDTEATVEPLSVCEGDIELELKFVENPQEN